METTPRLKEIGPSIMHMPRESHGCFILKPHTARCGFSHSSDLIDLVKHVKNNVQLSIGPNGAQLS